MKKCEICGKEKPEEEFSKSYKNRCKACVAEMVRNTRQSKERFFPGGPILIGDSSPTIAIDRPMMATFILQGLLASGYFPEHKSLPATAVALADELIKELGNDKSISHG